MATATVHKLPETEPIDPYACLLQAKGLLRVLLRNLGGELSKEERPTDSDVRDTIEAVSSLLADSVRAKPENVAASGGGTDLNTQARKTLQLAQGPLRLIHAASFIDSTDSISGKVEQALTDDALGDAVWAVADLVAKAERAMT